MRKPCRKNCVRKADKFFAHSGKIVYIAGKLCALLFKSTLQFWG